MSIGRTFRSGLILGILGLGAIGVSLWNTPATNGGNDQAVVHQQMQTRLASEPRSPNGAPAVCFAPGTPDSVIQAFHQAMGWGNGNDRFKNGTGWLSTATDGLTGGSGAPITLTYSFVPDGTPLVSGAGEPAAPSDFFAVMNGIYPGGPAQWQAVFHDVFARWSELIGVTYVFEPNDDGAASPSNDGSIGVRGDVRIGGHFIDGNSGILAFNFFPDAGDMTIDTADSFYTFIHANSVRLRNVAAHEHGHGMGIFHVCPIEQTKLMEPTVTAAYDGPQHDDIRAGHAQYGDILEPNNTTGTAFDFGVMNPGDSVSFADSPVFTFGLGSPISLSAFDQIDIYRIDTLGAARVSVAVAPLGLLYDDSTQGPTGACNSGSFTNSLLAADLAIDVIDGATSTSVGSVDATALGQPEAIVDLLLPSAGTYFVQISGAATDVQLYTMSISVDDAFLEPTVSFPNGAPDLLSTTSSTTFDVQIDNGEDTIVGGSTNLRYRYNGGTFLSVPLTVINAGAGQYSATLPAPLCASTPEFFVEASGATAGVVTNSLAGAAAPLTASVGTLVTLVSLDFETDPGWTVTNSPTLTDGAWEIGVPVNCGRADPPADFDGSGQCWLTANTPIVDPLVDCNSDVDDGVTILESVSYDISGLIDPKLTYARWFDNSIGGSAQEDPMFMTVSPDGGTTQILLEQVGPAFADAVPDIIGGWVEKTFDLAPIVGAATQFRIRFITRDTGLGSIVEAGIDAFRITGIQCSSVAVPCDGDANGDGVVNFTDITSVLGNWLGDGSTGGDANSDGIVNFTDITAVLGNWLFVCP